MPAHAPSGCVADVPPSSDRSAAPSPRLTRMAGVVMRFGPLELDPSRSCVYELQRIRLLTARQFDLLHPARRTGGAGALQDTVIEAAWSGVAVTDNSVDRRYRRSGVLRECGVPAAVNRNAGQAWLPFLGGPIRQKVERRRPTPASKRCWRPHAARGLKAAPLRTLERSPGHACA